MFDNLREDWVTYGRDISAPGFWVMVVYRFGRWRYTIRYALIRKPFSLAYKIAYVLAIAVTGAELPCEAELGRRVRIDHPQGLVVSGDARLGDDVVLRNGVTIGLRYTGRRGSPVIGNRVDIGAGAKILGEIQIGDDCCIGANAVVLRDMPAESIGVGVPADIRPRNKKNVWREECSTVF
jgi:serine O-acetyltransferase